MSNGQETIIAQGVKVEGDFQSSGDVLIDGEVSGSVVTQQSLRVGEAAVIEANVSAKSAVIAGRVKGNLKVQERVELASTAVVEGDLETAVVSVEPGAQLYGRVSVGASDTSVEVEETEEEHEEEE